MGARAPYAYIRAHPHDERINDRESPTVLLVISCALAYQSRTNLATKPPLRLQNSCTIPHQTPTSAHPFAHQRLTNESQSTQHVQTTTTPTTHHPLAHYPPIAHESITNQSRFAWGSLAVHLGVTCSGSRLLPGSFIAQSKLVQSSSIFRLNQ